jgi:serine/threonine protein kinase
VPVDIIGGYRLKTLMGTGQSSQVWEVVEMSSGRHFAMKMLLPEHARNAEHRRLLFHEAEVGLQLQHPNVIRIYKVHKDPKEPYYLMEFFPSGSLKRRLLNKEDEFIREKANDIFRQAATAFAYINSSGWVHRDIKPDNILVSAAGEVKVIDFAITQKMKKGFFERLLHRKGKPQGTRSYMSPEQIRDELLDPRADVYSFGATVYEVVTGRPPFRGANAQDLLNKHLYEKPISPQAHNPDVTDEFAALVLRMLAKKKEERPQNFHDVLMKLKTMKVFKVRPGQKSGKPA